MILQRPWVVWPKLSLKCILSGHIQFVIKGSASPGIRSSYIHIWFSKLKDHYGNLSTESTCSDGWLLDTSRDSLGLKLQDHFHKNHQIAVCTLVFYLCWCRSLSEKKTLPFLPVCHLKETTESSLVRMSLLYSCFKFDCFLSSNWFERTWLRKLVSGQMNFTGLLWLVSWHKCNQ